MRFRDITIIKTIVNHLVTYPTNTTLNYGWSFGSLLGLCLIMQIITGLLLSMFYLPDVEMAFYSVERIMRDVNGGWLIRYMHSNGASFFFILLYLHMFKAILIKSYGGSTIKLWVWYTGVIIFVLSMATAFMGYVLPWGQMSFWAATVITNLFTALPYVGEAIAYTLWGGFSVSNNTLNRFFTLHFVLPFVICIVVFIHLALLHAEGSTSIFGVVDSQDLINFYPYFFYKDLFSYLVFLFVYFFVVFFYPNLLSHPDNYIKANPLVTPKHIVPEWYFLFFYAILRSIPNKLLGVFYLIIGMCVLVIIPFLDYSYLQCILVRFYFYIWFWFFVSNLVVISWLGGQVAEEPFYLFSKLSILNYFVDVFIIIPFLNKIEMESFKPDV